MDRRATNDFLEMFSLARLPISIKSRSELPYDPAHKRPPKYGPLGGVAVVAALFHSFAERKHRINIYGHIRCCLQGKL